MGRNCDAQGYTHGRTAFVRPVASEDRRSVMADQTPHDKGTGPGGERGTTDVIRTQPYSEKSAYSAPPVKLGRYDANWRWISCDVTLGGHRSLATPSTQFDDDCPLRVSYRP